jgi:hypothetical protein
MTDKRTTELDAYTSPVNADVFPVVESATTTTKKISWATIKSTLATYLATLFMVKNSAITASTKTKITYDTNGLVTSGADATTADIADSTNKRYCTDAQKTVIGNTSGTNTGDETALRIGAIVNNATAKTTPLDADMLGLMDSAEENVIKKFSWANLKTEISTLFKAFTSASVASVSGAYSSDTYLAGSCITIPTAGGWKVGAQYRLLFEMSKTAAGTATFIISIRMGTAGDITDPAPMTITFSAGTEAADMGLFEVMVTFRTVGSGTSAVLRGLAKCQHHLAATGLVSTGASGCGIVTKTSSGFDSSIATKIGVSINGGTSFSGICGMVQAELLGIDV